MPHKNLFSGALGKLQNIGGSRIYTTPHTVSTPAEYSINVSYNVQGDLVGHSLDGRLWLYRRSRRLGIIALKWNAVTGKLEYSAAQNISNNDDVVLACGLDWVLTNNNIFMVTDEGEILSTRLFDANIPNTFLYSLLRSGTIGASGIDPFTGEAWGKREDNGNSEGNGYFSKSTHLLYPAGSHAFEQCYSLLPPVDDWQIFENFLVRRPNAETITSYNYMQAVRPLIPLEFANGTAVYGTGYNFDHRGIQLFHRNGEIFGKGFQNIGKVSLLPAVFSENGTVQEYYLYIQPDFTFYPYSDFFYCNISTFEVNTDDEAHIHSFAVASVARTWNEAKTICETLGGHLATSTSAEKNAFLVSLIGNNTVLLGGSDKDNEGSWQWLTGEGWSYTNWNSGEPNNSGSGEHYLELQVSGGWNDINASTSRYYICEWDYELGEKEFLGKAWQNIALASIGSDALYGFLSEQVDALSGITCFRSLDGRVLLPATGEFLTLSENNARLFFDVLSHKGLLLEDNGGQLMLGESLSDTQNIGCKTLQQWLAPAGKVDAVTNDYVVASADNSAFCTSLVTGFNRQFLSPNAIPLTAKTFQDSNEDYYRLAISDSVNESNRKVFGVNKILSQNVTPEAIQWQDVYKEAVKIEFLNLIEVPRNENPSIYAENYVDTPVFTLNTSMHQLILYSCKKRFTTKSIHWWADAYMDVYDTAYFDPPEEDTYTHVGFGGGTNFIHPNYVDKIYDHVETDIYFIDPDTGKMSEIQHISFSVPNNIVLKTVHYSGSGWYGYAQVPFQYDYQDVSEESTLYHEFNIVIHEHKVCISAINYFKGEREYFPVMDIPDNINPFTYSGINPTVDIDNIALNGKKLNLLHEDILPSTLSSYTMHFLFHEHFSSTIFAYSISSSTNWQTLSQKLASTYITFGLNLITSRCHHGVKIITNDSGSFSLVSLYIIFLYEDSRYTSREDENMFLLVFRTETKPDIFDFPAEVERSKSH